MKSRPKIVAILGALLSLVWALPGWAQHEAAAEALFRSARQASERGDWVTACDRFEESHRLEPAPGTVLNLAKCREKLGQIASAWKRYGEVVQRLPKADPRVTYARDKEKELEPLVPRLTLLAPQEAGDFRVTVNGMEVTSATFGVPLPFDPGLLSIRVEAEGRKAVEHKVEIASSEHLTEQLTLGALLDPETPKEPKVAPANDQAPSAAVSSSNHRTWGWVSVGVGAAGVGLGVVGFVLAGQEASITTDPNHCAPVGNLCNQTGVDASNRGEVDVILGWVGMGVGAVGLGVGTYLLVKPSGETVSVGVRPLLGGASLSIGGQL